MPEGFFGTGADLLIDTLIVAVAFVVVTMGIAWRMARHHRFTTHRNIQIVLASVLALAVTALEMDLKLNGGISKIAKGRLAGTPLFWSVLAVHLSFAIPTAAVWGGLIAVSLLRFPRPPRPSGFSRIHRRWGRVGMIGMLGTGVTALVFYLVAFVL